MVFENSGHDREHLGNFGVSRRRVLGAMGAGIGGLSAFVESAAAEPNPLKGVRIETVATNLDVPWGQHFGMKRYTSPNVQGASSRSLTTPTR
jgi:hypothetical protein